MNKRAISLSVILMTGITLHAQTKMNALKTDPLVLFNAALLKYERVIKEDITVQMGAFYAWEIPSFGGEYAEAKGFGITPEFRYYLSHKRPAPKGIYLAPNFRYQKYLTKNHDENSEATIIANSPAMNMGYQLALKDVFIMEVWLGIAYYFRKVVDETIPGASIGYSTSNKFQGRAGISIGVLF